MMPIILFVFVFSLLLGRLSKRPEPPVSLAITSFAIIGMALYVILSHGYSPHDKDWAYVSLGIAIGLWLRNSRQQPMPEATAPPAF